VLAAANELGYEPNLLAQSLRRGASLSIGFVVRDISSPVLSEIALGAERTLHASGYSLVLTNSEGLPSLDREYIRYFRLRRVDGILLSLADEAYEPTLEELGRLHVPSVILDRDVPASLGASRVLCDNRGGILAACRHLAELGHRHFGLIGGPLAVRPGRECASALHDFCSTHPGFAATIETGPYTREYGAEAIDRIVARKNLPTALIAGSIHILIGALHALSAQGVRIPEDASLVAFDDSEFLELMEPPIAVISRNPLKMGQAAAELLLRRLKGGEPEETIVPTNFIPRASCAPPPRTTRLR